MVCAGGDGGWMGTQQQGLVGPGGARVFLRLLTEERMSSGAVGGDGGVAGSHDCTPRSLWLRRGECLVGRSRGRSRWHRPSERGCWLGPAWPPTLETLGGGVGTCASGLAVGSEGSAR